MPAVLPAWAQLEYQSPLLRPAGRAICGMNAGGICAFTAAWEHPEAFSKVVSHCGSFVDFRGGHNYPLRIRQSPPKPLRIFLQSGARDLDFIVGSWSIANHDVAAAFIKRFALVRLRSCGHYAPDERPHRKLLPGKY